MLENIISQRDLTRNLTAAALILICLNVANLFLGQPSWQFTRLIHLGLESNLPTWFSSLMLAVAAFYAYRCSLREERRGAKTLWMIFSFGFLAMSCDEVAMIHESLGGMINKYFTRQPCIGHSAWVVLLGPIAVLLILVFCLRLKKYFLDSPGARLFFLGASVYVLGAFLFEATINFLNHDSLEWAFRLENLLEESCELFGVILIISGLRYHERYLVEMCEASTVSKT